MTHTFNLATAALAVLGLVGGASPALAESEPFGRLEVGQVEALLGASDVRIFDVNSVELYASGHVPGATWASLSGLEKRLPADKTLRLVFYCKNGH